MQKDTPEDRLLSLIKGKSKMDHETGKKTPTESEDSAAADFAKGIFLNSRVVDQKLTEILHR